MPATPDFSVIVIVPAAAASGVVLGFAVFAVVDLVAEVVRALVGALRRRRARAPGGQTA